MQIMFQGTQLHAVAAPCQGKDTLSSLMLSPLGAPLGQWGHAMVPFGSSEDTIAAEQDCARICCMHCKEQHRSAAAHVIFLSW